MARQDDLAAFVGWLFEASGYATLEQFAEAVGTRPEQISKWRAGAGMSGANLLRMIRAANVLDESVAGGPPPDPARDVSRKLDLVLAAVREPGEEGDDDEASLDLRLRLLEVAVTNGFAEIRETIEGLAAPASQRGRRPPAGEAKRSAGGAKR